MNKRDKKPNRKQLMAKTKPRKCPFCGTCKMDTSINAYGQIRGWRCSTSEAWEDFVFRLRDHPRGWKFTRGQLAAIAEIVGRARWFHGEVTFAGLVAHFIQEIPRVADADGFNKARFTDACMKAAKKNKQ